MGLTDLLTDAMVKPAECVVRVGGEEIAELYPFLVEVRVDCGREQPSVATLELESRRDEHGRWSVQDAGVFEPWKRIVIEAVFGATTEEVMRGYVREVYSEFPEDPGTCRVTVECQDESFALDREERRVAWGADGNKTSDAAIVAAIADRHELQLHPESGVGLDGLVLHQSTTDVRFLRWRAESNGYELSLRRGTLYFGPMRLEANPQPTILVYAGRDTNCLHLSVREDAHLPDRVAFDVASAEDAESVERVVEPDLPLLGPEPAARETDLPEFTWRMSRAGSADERQLLAVAQRKANETSMKVEAEGELDGSLYGHVLRCGEPVPVDGLGERLSGTYYVDTVTHSFNAEGYRQGFRLLRNAYGDNVGVDPLTKFP